MGYRARIVADSVSERGDRLTTMEVTFPRIILSEFNTHRMFSRNNSSSRAIPIEKRIAAIEEDPFIPNYWGKNQRGMQAEEALDEAGAKSAEAIWLQAMSDAIAHAKSLASHAVHKQLANRLIEPFAWQTVIVTATEWENFFALRDNDMAQPEIHEIAHMMREIYDGSVPNLVKQGEWHLPLIQDDERDGKFEHSQLARQVSAARCARVSYLTHDGKRDIEADVTLFNRLVTSGHMSPLEHPATPCVKRYQIEEVFYDDLGLVSKEKNWVVINPFIGNFRGWKQLRKSVPHEDNFAMAAKE